MSEVSATREVNIMSFEYVIKFVVGASPRSPEVLAPGYYWTAINLFNPSPCTDALLSWKAARALPGLIAGPSSPWSLATLERGRGFEIDNADIDRALQLAGDDRKPFEHPLGSLAHAKGFVVIRSEVELDIVAVYTASEGHDRGLALHTERVVGRRIERRACGTTRFNLDTKADNGWLLVSTPNGASAIVPTVYRHPLWQSGSGGVKWFGYKTAASGVFAFERTFTLDCDGPYALTGHLSLRSDAGVRCLLNGTAFASAPGNYGVGMPIAQLPLPPSSLLRVGVNTLRIEVTNVDGPMGLMLDGQFDVQGASCDEALAEPEPREPEPREPEPPASAELAVER